MYKTVGSGAAIYKIAVVIQLSIEVHASLIKSIVHQSAPVFLRIHATPNATTWMKLADIREVQKRNALIYSFNAPRDAMNSVLLFEIKEQLLAFHKQLIKILSILLYSYFYILTR